MDNQSLREESNKALLHRLYEQALHRGKLAIIDEIFSPIFTDHSAPDQPVGPAGVKAYFLAVRAGFPDIRVVIEDMLAKEDKVVVRTVWSGTHLGVYEDVPPTGRPAMRTLIQIFRLADGLIVEEWNEGAGLLA